MLRRTSMLRTNSILRPIASFYNNYYNNENSNNYNKDLTEMMNDGIRRSIEISKKKDQDIIIKKYLKYQEDQKEQDYQVINNFLNFNHTNYIFFVLSFLAGYHFRYFIERNKNT